MCRLSRLVYVGSFATAVLLAGCRGSNPDNGTVVASNASAPLSAREVASPALNSSAPGTATADIAEIIKDDKIERVSAPPPPDPTPSRRVYPKPVDFTPPPLPPELLDDGGLKPLPPRRAQSTEPAK